MHEKHKKKFTVENVSDDLVRHVVQWKNLCIESDTPLANEWPREELISDFIRYLKRQEVVA